MGEFTLDRNPSFPGIEGQLVLLILDGVGLYKGRTEGYEGNAVDLASTPTLDRLLAEAPICHEAQGPRYCGRPTER